MAGYLANTLSFAGGSRPSQFPAVSANRKAGHFAASAQLSCQTMWAAMDIGGGLRSVIWATETWASFASAWTWRVGDFILSLLRKQTVSN
jgi:hypothetical protein